MKRMQCSIVALTVLGYSGWCASLPAPSDSSSKKQEVFTIEAQPAGSQPTIKVPVAGAYQLCGHKTMDDLTTFINTAAYSCDLTSTRKQACWVQMQYDSTTAPPTVSPKDCPSDYLEVRSLGNTVWDFTNSQQLASYNEDNQTPADNTQANFYTNNGYTCSVPSNVGTTYTFSQVIHGDWSTTWGGLASYVSYNDPNGCCNIDKWGAYSFPRKPTSPTLFLPVGTVNPQSTASILWNVKKGTQLSYQGKLVQITAISSSYQCVYYNTGVPIGGGVWDPGPSGTCQYSSFPSGGSVPPGSAWYVTYTYTASPVICNRPAGYYPASTSIDNPNNYSLPSPNSFTNTYKICSKRLDSYEINDPQGNFKQYSTAEETCADNSPGTVTP